MIAVDTNILVYAHRRDSPFHAAARQCVIALAEGNAPWAIPWPCLFEFWAIVTHPKIYRPPSTEGAAAGQIDAWLASPSLLLLSEPEGHWPHARATLIDSAAIGGRAHDARIAALCLMHRVRELYSADRDFSRFSGLRVSNPLLGSAR